MFFASPETKTFIVVSRCQRRTRFPLHAKDSMLADPTYVIAEGKDYGFLVPSETVTEPSAPDSPFG